MIGTVILAVLVVLLFAETVSLNQALYGLSERITKLENPNDPRR